MKKYLCIIVVFMICGCGGIDVPDIGALSKKQLRITSVAPQEGALVGKTASIKIDFSDAIDPLTVDPTTFVVTSLADESVSNNDLVQSISKGEVQSSEGRYEMSDDARSVVFSPADNFESGKKYIVALTNKIMSASFVPLTTNVSAPAKPFVSSFEVEAESSDSNNANSSDSETQDSGETSDPVPVRPSFFVINEILYDAVGEDTNGDVFIELYGEAATNIGGFKLLLINGDDGVISATLEIPKGATVPDDGIYLIADAKTGSPGVSNIAGVDLILNFDPQNGPDCVELLNEKGELVDALGYGTPIAALAKNNLKCFEGTPAVKTTSGKSLSRTLGADSGDNSKDFITLSSPAPGAL